MIPWAYQHDIWLNLLWRNSGDKTKPWIDWGDVTNSWIKWGGL
jgi:hypothetical protein